MSQLATRTDCGKIFQRLAIRQVESLQGHTRCERSDVCEPAAVAQVERLDVAATRQRADGHPNRRRQVESEESLAVGEGREVT